MCKDVERVMLSWRLLHRCCDFHKIADMHNTWGAAEEAGEAIGEHVSDRSNHQGLSR